VVGAGVVAVVQFGEGGGVGGVFVLGGPAEAVVAAGAGGGPRGAANFVGRGHVVVHVNNVIRHL